MGSLKTLVYRMVRRDSGFHRPHHVVGLGEIGTAVLGVGLGCCLCHPRPLPWRGRLVDAHSARGRLWLGMRFSLRSVREAVNTLYRTQVGGDILALTFWAVPARLRRERHHRCLDASCDATLFAALGLLMLLRLRRSDLAWIAATGLALAIPMLGGFT